MNLVLRRLRAEDEQAARAAQPGDGRYDSLLLIEPYAGPTCAHYLDRLADVRHGTNVVPG